MNKCEESMQINIIDFNQHQIAEIVSDEIVITTEREALDILADAGYQGAGSLIIREQQLAPEFFDLKTRLAGDILQKFSNYRMRVAIIGDFYKYDSSSLQAFIRESNRGNLVFFVANREEAIGRLTRD
jgi:hypothetical protein